MTILVTAASGHLGRLVIDSLLARGTDAADIVAGARTPHKIADIAARGIRVVELDYMKPDTIAAALEGIDSVLLISGSDPGDRLTGHRNVITAAAAAGVDKLVYTSAPNATSTDFVLAADHKATEEALHESGLPVVVLRNNWYTENYLPNLLTAADSGVLAAAVGDGRVASASRADYAEAAAVVLTQDGHLGETYELGGDVAWDYADLARAASDVLGRDVVFVSVSLDGLVSALTDAGLDAGTAGFAAAIDAGIAAGALSYTDGTLRRLIGHPTTPLAEGLRAVLATSRTDD